MEIPPVEADRRTIEEYLFGVHQTLFEGQTTPEMLIHLHPLIEPHHWQAIHAERASQLLCGLPLCPHRLLVTSRAEAHQRISLRQRKVWRIADRGPFCSAECEGKAKRYEETLSKEPIWLRWPQVRNAILGIKPELLVRERDVELVRKQLGDLNVN